MVRCDGGLILINGVCNCKCIIRLAEIMIDRVDFMIPTLYAMRRLLKPYTGVNYYTGVGPE